MRRSGLFLGHFTGLAFSLFLLNGARAQTILAVTNAASFAVDNLAPGSIGVLFGSDLAPGTAQATGSGWPTQLAGVSVYVDGTAAPIYFVSPGQINFQVS